MKFKIQSTQFHHQIQKTPKLVIQNVQGVVQGDNIEFQKQVYQSIQSYLKGDSREILREIQEHQGPILNQLIERVLQDSVKTMVNRVTKAEMGQQQKDLVMIKGLVKIMNQSIDLEATLGGDPWIYNSLVAHLELTYKPTIESCLISFFKFLSELAQVSFDSIQFLLQEVENLDLLYFGSFQNLFDQLFQQSQDEIQQNQYVQMVNSAFSKFKKMQVKEIDQNFDYQNCKKNYAYDTQTFGKFRSAFEKSLILKMNGLSLMDIIQLKESHIASLTSQSILSEHLINSVNNACLRSLKGNNSQQIAQSLLSEPSEPEMIIKILQFNTDKDKLEIEIRKAMIAYYVDRRQNLEMEKVIQVLQGYFGQKFCQKLTKIAQQVDNGGENLTLPCQLWPMNVSIKPRNELSQWINDFTQSYAQKNQKKKIQTILPFLGTVELVYKSQSFTASGLIAHILLCFNDRISWNCNDLSAQVGISADSLLEISQNCSLLSLNNGHFSICNSKVVDCILPSSKIITMMQQDIATALPTSDTSQLKYMHKEHKFRVQSFIVRQLKKELSIAFDQLVQRVMEHFRQNKELLIDITQENVLKNIDDLIEKSYVSRDEDLGVYEYVRD